MAIRKFENTLSFARKLDAADPLKSFRKEFNLPKIKGKTAIYFTGNSLGLQPKSTAKFLKQELEDWATLGVAGHHHAKRPWLHYHMHTKKALSQLTGSKPSEVVAMNQLTVNLHLMMASFYRPNKNRFKILIEKNAFSSDQYAVETQIRWHGLNPADVLVEVGPREGEFLIRTDDIIDAINLHGPQLALVLLGGVHYYTGQFLKIDILTQAGHNAGALVGFDLAHAIGNVPLTLHDDQVDFAVWCSYKYLNSGPGGVGGAFVHEKHGRDFSLPRLAGWWGHDEGERFQMKKGFIPMEGIDGWQLSNFSVLSGAAHLAALDLHKKAGMRRLRKKSELLTGYLYKILKEVSHNNKYFTIITPEDVSQRGCQLSLFFKEKGKQVFDRITRAGIFADWREPGAIRVAPVPLYNTFEEVYRFGEIIRKSLGE